VILEAYLPNRGVWQCPSANVVGGARWILPGPDWLGYLQAHEGEWGQGVRPYRGGPCDYAYPPGWGGEVTDSIAQCRLAVPWFTPLYAEPAAGAFLQSIVNTLALDVRVPEIAAPDRFVIVADGQTEYPDVGAVAYPEICSLDCANAVCGEIRGRWVDWDVCTVARDCGLYRTAPSNGSFLVNPALRAPYARHRAPSSSAGPPWTRNGVNVGFLDGHAQWMASETLIAEVAAGLIDGLQPWGPTSDCGFADDHPGVPTIY
jgi:prepilin-type processing-associated H-X9-DG protein